MTNLYEAYDIARERYQEALQASVAGLSPIEMKRLEEQIITLHTEYRQAEAKYQASLGQS